MQAMKTCSLPSSIADAVTGIERPGFCSFKWIDLKVAVWPTRLYKGLDDPPLDSMMPLRNGGDRMKC